MEGFLSAGTLTIELLLVASLVAIAVRRLRIPYTVALVLVGLLITFRQPLEVELTPDVILALFVPPLIFEAAFRSGAGYSRCAAHSGGRSICQGRLWCSVNGRPSDGSSSAAFWPTSVWWFYSG